MHKVLIIDDDPVSQKVMKSALVNSDDPYDIRQCRSAKAGMDEIRSNPPDVILLDLYFPDMDGFDFLKEFNPGKSHAIPVILVSQFRNDTEIVKGVELGISDFISKPIDTNELLSRVKIQIINKKMNDDIQWAAEKTNKSIKSLYNSLKKKNDRLQELDRIKDELVNTVSHELRTPLAISKEAINLVLDGIGGDITDKQRKYLTSSRDNLLRLNTIIDEFLDMSKLEAGKIKIKPAYVDICAVIQQLAEDYQKIFARKNQTFITDIPDSNIILFADADKVVQVINNLLNNAFKFTPEGGRVELNICEESMN